MTQHCVQTVVTVLAVVLVAPLPAARLGRDGGRSVDASAHPLGCAGPAGCLGLLHPHASGTAS